MDKVKQEHGGLPDNPLDDIAHALREAGVAAAKQTLLTLVSSIDGKNAGHCLSMISSYCTSCLDTLTALVPELAASPKKKSSSTPLNLYTQMSPGMGGEVGGVMMGNETFGASILTQAMAAVGPMMQSQQAKALTAALASAKEAKLSVEIVSVLESSLRSALGVSEIAPEPMMEPIPVPMPLHPLAEELVGALSDEATSDEPLVGPPITAFVELG